MLMYQLYIPLSQPFSPCLALAREIVNRFSEPCPQCAAPLLTAYCQQESAAANFCCLGVGWVYSLA
ncbi:hypothetical protein VI26_19125 [Chromobacterium sp. LK1]|nr:hypothetical protein VI26_19125 [Chromobacterium sp. LK1]